MTWVASSRKCLRASRPKWPLGPHERPLGARPRLPGSSEGSGKGLVGARYFPVGCFKSSSTLEQ